MTSRCLRRADIVGPNGFDAVIVAGALYANRWHHDARRFVRRNRAALGKLPVWLVSSGPLDDTAAHRDIEPTAQVRKLAARIGARGHVTFGGCLSPDAKGFPASALAKTKSGDWRDLSASASVGGVDRRATRRRGSGDLKPAACPCQ